jgi:hypothetical protein
MATTNKESRAEWVGGVPEGGDWRERLERVLPHVHPASFEFDVRPPLAVELVKLDGEMFAFRTLLRGRSGMAHRGDWRTGHLPKVLQIIEAAEARWCK